MANKVDKLARAFCEKVFKIHPEIMGMNICAVTTQNNKNSIGDLTVKGAYIENKNFKEKNE